MTDPHLRNKIASCTSVRELDALVKAFAERDELFPADHRADVLSKQRELEQRRSRSA